MEEGREGGRKEGRKDRKTERRDDRRKIQMEAETKDSHVCLQCLTERDYFRVKPDPLPAAMCTKLI